MSESRNMNKGSEKAPGEIMREKYDKWEEVAIKFYAEDDREAILAASQEILEKQLENIKARLIQVRENKKTLQAQTNSLGREAAELGSRIEESAVGTAKRQADRLVEQDLQLKNLIGHDFTINHVKGEQSTINHQLVGFGPRS